MCIPTEVFERWMDEVENMRRRDCISFDEEPPHQYADGSTEARPRQFRTIP